MSQENTTNTTPSSGDANPAMDTDIDTIVEMTHKLKLT
jgi:hypothetical protein